MNTKLMGHIYAFVSITIWGSTYIVSKIVLETIMPAQVLFIRFLIASIVLTMFYPKFKKMKSIKVEALLFITALCLLGYFVSENTALTKTYATNVSLIVATIPIISLIIARFIGDKTHLNKNIIVGFIIAYLGVVVIVTVNGDRSSIKFTGDAIAFLAAISFSFYSFVLVKVNGKYNIIHLTRNIFYYMTILLFIYNLTKGTFTTEYYPIEEIFEFKMFLSLLFLGVVASSFSFLMWNQSIKLIGNIRTSQYIYFGPIVTTVFAAFILNESITIVTVMGTLMIICGVYLAEMKYKPKTKIIKKSNIRCEV